MSFIGPLCAVFFPGAGSEVTLPSSRHPMGNGERVEGRVDFQSRFDAHYHFGGMAAEFRTRMSYLSCRWSTELKKENYENA